MPETRRFEERRLSIRFPLRLGAYCGFRKRRAPRAFPIKRTGEIQDLSAGGCCLAILGDFIEAGMIAQLQIEWPAKINNHASLVLCIWGDVVRVEKRYVAVAITRYEFRLRGSDRFAPRTKGARFFEVRAAAY